MYYSPVRGVLVIVVVLTIGLIGRELNFMKVNAVFFSDLPQDGATADMPNNRDADIQRYRTILADAKDAQHRQQENGNTAFQRRKHKRTKKCTSGIRFKDPNMRLCSYIRPLLPNFGDALGPVVVRRLLEQHFNTLAGTPNQLTTCAVPFLHVDTRRRKHSSETCLLILGSILHFMKPNDHVWSTGINLYRQELLMKKPYPHNVTYHSVRGPKAIRYLRNQGVSLVSNATLTDGYTIPYFPYGDPGVLIPTLFPKYRRRKAHDNTTTATATTTPRFCFVPHNSDGQENLDRLSNNDDDNNNPNMLLIRANQSWITVFDEMSTNCDYVASSSLHGIISADALQLPSLWFQWQNSNTSDTEGSFKYLDYLESIQRVPPKSNKVATLQPHHSINVLYDPNSYWPPLGNAKLQRIIQRTKSSFPYHLFEQW